MKIELKHDDVNNTDIIQWLSQFKDISDSLLLELDHVNKKFIAKTFTLDRSLVKYSEFLIDESSGFSFIDIPKDLDSNRRVKIGIFMILSKVIEVFSTFNDVPYSLVIDFEAQEEDDCYEATELHFNSSLLKMNVRGASVSEFQYLSDDLFHKTIYSCSNPFKAELSKETIKNILSVSSIFSTDKDKDRICFYPKKDDSGKWILHATDPIRRSYDLAVANIQELESSDDIGNASLNIFRSKFALAMKSVMTSALIQISGTDPSRLLIEEDDKNPSYTAISAVVY